MGAGSIPHLCRKKFSTWMDPRSEASCRGKFPNYHYLALWMNQLGRGVMLGWYSTLSVLVKLISSVWVTKEELRRKTGRFFFHVSSWRIRGQYHILDFNTVAFPLTKFEASRWSKNSSTALALLISCTHVRTLYTHWYISAPYSISTKEDGWLT